MNPVILANLLREYVIRLAIMNREKYCDDPSCHNCGQFWRDCDALLRVVERMERHIRNGKRLSITLSVAEMHIVNLPAAWYGYPRRSDHIN